MNTPEPNIRVNVDVTNPGQFFACCGLLELADRLWDGAEGWFDESKFVISTGVPADLQSLLAAANSIQLIDDDLDVSRDESDDEQIDEKTSPLNIVSPISVTLNWWIDKSLKTWAGSMNVKKIFVAMCHAVDVSHRDPLNQGQVVFDPLESSGASVRGKKGTKREPFYFDTRRASNAWSTDVGFSANAIKLNTVAYPVVESMALIGLQRCRPKPVEGAPRVFHYFSWSRPLSTSVLPAAVAGLINPLHGFCFKNAFRTDQNKHKAFNPATPIYEVNHG